MARSVHGVGRLTLPVQWGVRDSLASLVSNVAAPPVLALLAAVLLSAQSVERGGWVWAVAFAGVAVCLPTLYIVVQVQRGCISDIHVPIRAQRTRPFLVTLACSVALWVAFVWWQAPAGFKVLATANLAQATLLFCITLRWKVSMHSAAAGGLLALSLTVLGVSLFSAFGLLCAAAVAVIAWARIRLERHTPAQTVVGALLGSLVTLFAVWVIL